MNGARIEMINARVGRRNIFDLLSAKNERERGWNLFSLTTLLFSSNELLPSIFIAMRCMLKRVMFYECFL